MHKTGLIRVIMADKAIGIPADATRWNTDATPMISGAYIARG